MACFYFLTENPSSLTKGCFIDNSYCVPVLESYRNWNKNEPVYLYAGDFDEDGRCHLYDTEGDFSCNAKWKDIGIFYFAVRHNPGFPYPETIISENGVFKTPWEANSYTEKYGGEWKAYKFKELQLKMAESLQIEEQLKQKTKCNKICDGNCPSNCECPFDKELQEAAEAHAWEYWSSEQNRAEDPQGYKDFLTDIR